MPCIHHPLIDDGLVACWRCQRLVCPNCTVSLQENPFCGECKAAQARDLLAGTNALRLPFPSPGRRFLAAVIDGLIKWGIGMVVGMIFQFLLVAVSSAAATKNNPAWVFSILGLSTLSQLGLQGLYDGGMTLWCRGQTVGKMALSMRVVTPEGEPISGRQAWFRALVKILPGGCCCFFSLADGLFALGDEGASLHDLIARTRVIDV